MASCSIEIDKTFVLYLSEDEAAELRTTLTMPLAAMNDDCRKRIHDALKQAVGRPQQGINFPEYKE